MPKLGRTSMLHSPSTKKTVPLSGLDAAASDSTHTPILKQVASNASLSETTGYRSGRSGSNLPSTIETRSSPDGKGPPSAEAVTNAAAYTAMSTIRSSRMSTMLSRSNSAIGLNPAETPKTSPLASKTFKEFYIGLLEEHDATHLTHLGQNKKPKTFKLSAVFGERGDGVDPMHRLFWLAAQYEALKKDPSWSTVNDDPMTPTSPLKSQEICRVVDIDLEERPKGLTIDATSTAGLEMVKSGSLQALMDGLVIPGQQ
ncbi:hypothetical protein HDU91_004576, partial [Kappamyces sp. JEL0680]